MAGKKKKKAENKTLNVETLMTAWGAPKKCIASGELILKPLAGLSVSSSCLLHCFVTGLN
jgi:hypothetical protein